MMKLLASFKRAALTKLPEALFFGVVCLLVSSSCTYAAALTSKPLKFVAISDIHFNPFLSCDKKKPCQIIKKLQKIPASQWHQLLASSPGDMYQYRQNANYALLQSSLKAASKTAKDSHAKFVLVLGDSLAHHYRRQFKRYTLDYSRAGYQSFVRKTLQFISLELANAFPGISIYNVVGNNDGYHYDYRSYPGGQFFSDTAHTWASLIKQHSQRSALLRQFPYAGYYSFSLNPSLRLIVLNSVLFSTKAKGRRVSQAADKQLLWLKKELAEAKTRKQKIFIAMHIPSGIDIYAHLNYRILRLLELWKHEDVLQFEADLNQYSTVVEAIFTGHLHRDWFQFVTLSNQGRIAVLGSPAISPIYGNNPGYKLYTYTPESKQFIDFETFYLPLNKRIGWQAALRMTRPDANMCQLSPGGSQAGSERLFDSLSLRRDRRLVQSEKWRAIYHCHLSKEAIISA